MIRQEDTRPKRWSWTVFPVVPESYTALNPLIGKFPQLLGVLNGFYFRNMLSLYELSLANNSNGKATADLVLSSRIRNHPDPDTEVVERIRAQGEYLTFATPDLNRSNLFSKAWDNTVLIGHIDANTGSLSPKRHVIPEHENPHLKWCEELEYAPELPTLLTNSLYTIAGEGMQRSWLAAQEVSPLIPETEEFSVIGTLYLPRLATPLILEGTIVHRL